MGSKLTNYLWGLGLLVRVGIPKTIFRLGGGPGDHLLVSPALRRYGKQTNNIIWMMSRFPELFTELPPNVKIVPESWRLERLANKLSFPVIDLAYCKVLSDDDTFSQPDGHIIEHISKIMGVVGTMELHPMFNVTTSSSAGCLLPKHFVAIQSANNGASTPMNNKSWNVLRFQAVVDELRNRYQFVQLGTTSDPPLANVLDLRGRTTLIEVGEILAQATFFVGLVGFLMHMSRAVNTRAIIIYGGREHPKQSGYPCNENLHYPAPCSPCWRLNECPYGKACMNEIRVNNVLKASERLERRLDDTVEASIVTVNDTLQSKIHPPTG